LEPHIFHSSWKSSKPRRAPKEEASGRHGKHSHRDHHTVGNTVKGQANFFGREDIFGNLTEEKQQRMGEAAKGVLSFAWI